MYIKYDLKWWTKLTSLIWFTIKTDSLCKITADNLAIYFFTKTKTNVYV